MKELLSLWKYTRMIVLVAVCAAVYAAVLIPFKIAVPLVPGFTEIRPANALPIVFSLLFGPAAAWGSAFGNLIGDFFGTLGLGSLFGMIGNFLYGYLPYRIWRRISSEPPSLNTGKQIIQLVLIVLLASGACGLTIGWGVDLLGFVPFAALGNIIVLNNFVIAIILSPIVMRILYTRVERWGLLHQDTMEAEDRSEGIAPRLGLMLVVIGVLGGLIFGNVISFGLYDIRHPFAQEAGRGLLGIGAGLIPAMVLMIVGAVLL